MELNKSNMTERMKRESEYHRLRAKERKKYFLENPIGTEKITRDLSNWKWWNASWYSYRMLRKMNLRNKKILVMGCGYGVDAILLSHLSDHVFAFDLSSESLEIAKCVAGKQGKSKIEFAQMMAEEVEYPDSFFDIVYCRDTLHHVDIPKSISEILRVIRNGGVFIADEIYSHKSVTFLRGSKFVNNFIYPKFINIIYPDGDFYITEDEQKLDEEIVYDISCNFNSWEVNYFSCIVDRFVSKRFAPFAKIDRSFLRLFGSLGSFLAGRVVMKGEVRK